MHPDERSLIDTTDLDHTDDPDRVSSALFTDLYHLDAAYVAWRRGNAGQATFDLFTRRTPFGGGFMLFAGLDHALDYLQSFRYADEDLAWLERIKGYPTNFLDWLRGFRFSGNIFAMEEGDIAFAREPMVRVTAPFPEALLLESGLLRTIGISTLLATKAARITIAARGRAVSDFAFRRAHEPFWAARSGYIGGCDSTSFVAAAKQYDIPSAGTIPHALVQAWPSELEAFRAVAEVLPSYSLLLDTYDVRQGTVHAIQVAKETADTGHVLNAVRLDSGDLIADSKVVRGMLDDVGMEQVKVLVSGDIDEYRIEEILDADAPVDGFGVGGNLGVGLGSVEHGTVGGVIGAVYKLAWMEGEGGVQARMKVAGTKSTWPGQKMVYRIGEFDHDLITEDAEPAPVGSKTMLTPWMMNGEPVRDTASLKDIRQYALSQLDALPERLRDLTTPDDAYDVRWSDDLTKLRDETMRYIEETERA